MLQESEHTMSANGHARETQQELKGKIALITGGGRGLGEAICNVLSEAGATVISADVQTDLATGVVEKIKAAGGEAQVCTLDVTDEGQAMETLDRIVEQYGKLDILINNAAIDKTVSIEELSVSEWDQIMAVNLRGPFVMSKFALPIMKRQESGSIINIASTAAKRAWPNASVYHASKWGLLGFTHALHTEARPHGIKVTAVIAGGMRTPFLLDRFPDIDINNLQDPRNVAQAIRAFLSLPPETVIPELTVLPMRETSWP